MTVIDILRNPQLARGDQIIAATTLIKKLPPPLRRLIGDMSDTERFLVGIDLKPKNS
jgi:circadian clock protein KaiB